jgi:hypothetical protein
LHNLEKSDELYIIQLELHYALEAAKIKNFPHNYRGSGSNAIIQFYIPSTRWDKDFFEMILINELGDKYMKVVTDLKE